MPVPAQHWAGKQPQQTALPDRALQAAAVLLPVVGAEARRAVTEAELKLPARQLRAQQRSTNVSLLSSSSRRGRCRGCSLHHVHGDTNFGSGVLECVACLLSHLARCDVSTHVRVAVHYQNNKHCTCCHMNALCSFQYKQQQQQASSSSSSKQAAAAASAAAPFSSSRRRVGGGVCVTSWQTAQSSCVRERPHGIESG